MTRVEESGLIEYSGAFRSFYTDVWQDVTYSGPKTSVDLISTSHRKELAAGLGSYDVGGDFFLNRRTILNIRPFDFSSFGDGEGTPRTLCRGVHGAPWGPYLQLLLMPYGAWTDSQMDLKGTTAIARVDPLRSSSDIAGSLAELQREGIRAPLDLVHAIKRGEGKVHAGTSDYLNSMFGWLPLISDVMDIAKSTRNANAILQQYARDSGKNVRRRYQFPRVEETRILQNSLGWLGGGSPDQAIGVDSSQKQETDYWFSGCFVYGLPAKETMTRIQELQVYGDKLYGLRPDLETFWNLTPWSWAVDWFTNVGDAVHNAVSFEQDGLVMRWGYVMRHSSLFTGIDARARNYPLNGGQSYHRETLQETKQRRRAHPFGFGVTNASLSPRQISIAMALGLNRATGRF